jgi:hypothetical protein
LSAAKNQAKTQLSQIFSQQIEASETLNQTTKETSTNQNQTFLQEVKKQTEITVETSNELIGVSIERSESVFQNGRTTYFALAVLDKEQAATNYYTKYRNAREDLRSRIKKARTSDEPIQRLRFLASAKKLARAAEQYKNQLSVLKNMGATPNSRSGSSPSTSNLETSKEQFEEEMERNLGNDTNSTPTQNTNRRIVNSEDLTPAAINTELMELLSKLTVQVKSLELQTVWEGQSFGDQLRGIIQEQFTELGFQTTSDRESASLGVTGRLSTNYTTKGRETDKAIRWDITLSLKAMSSGEIFGTINESGITVGLDSAMAESRTRQIIIEWLKQDLNTLIVKQLLRS